MANVADSPSVNVDWRNSPIGWFFFSFAPTADNTVAVFLGTMPFLDTESEWPPPCYHPFNDIINCYRIEEQGMTRRASEKETEGLPQCQTFTPALLADFLRERLKAGELTKI